MMNIQKLLRSVQRGATLLLPKINQNVEKTLDKGFHSMNSTLITNAVIPNQLNNHSLMNLLRPNLPLLNLSCGMKVRGKLQLRCKDCYFVCYKARWYVRCKSHPRHKAAQMVKAERNTWILTSVQQSKKRPWW